MLIEIVNKELDENWVSKGVDENGMFDTKNEDEDMESIVSEESENEIADESENLLLSEDEVSNQENEYVKDLQGQSSVRIGELQSTDAISNYENSEDELNVPAIINDKTDFKKLKWCVGRVSLILFNLERL